MAGSTAATLFAMSATGIYAHAETQEQASPVYATESPSAGLPSPSRPMQVCAGYATTTKTSFAAAEVPYAET